LIAYTGIKKEKEKRVNRKTKKVGLKVSKISSVQNSDGCLLFGLFIFVQRKKKNRLAW